MSKPRNPQAFPRPVSANADHVGFPTWRIQSADGMTLRDYFAAKAMQGIVGSIDSEEGYTRLVEVAHVNGCQRVSEWIAKDAYKQADAMLAEREKADAL